MAGGRSIPSEYPVKVDALMRISIGRVFVGACIMLISVLLANCGLIAENNSNVFVAPGKYDYYSCDQLAEAGRLTSGRERELTELTERAGQGPAGGVVSVLAYKTELVQARGALKQIGDVSVRKNCSVQSKWQSDRALW
jgi:hypothetical protein